MGSRENFAADVAAHPFLLGLNEHHVRLLADCAVRVAFEADQVLFREGETANRFYLIERGEVVLESNTAGGEAIVIDTIGDGDLLGWSWLFAPYVWRFTARATKPTRAMFFYGTVLREYCETSHARIRAAQADERSDDASTAISTGKTLSGTCSRRN